MRFNFFSAEEFSNEFFTQCKNTLYTKCFSSMEESETQDPASIIKCFNDVVSQYVLKEAEERKIKISNKTIQNFCLYLRSEVYVSGDCDDSLIAFWEKNDINEIEVNKKPMSPSDFKSLYEWQRSDQKDEIEEFKNEKNNNFFFSIFKNLIKNKFCSNQRQYLKEVYITNILEAFVLDYYFQATDKEASFIDLNGKIEISHRMCIILKELELIEINNYDEIEFQNENIEKLIDEYAEAPEELQKKFNNWLEMLEERG